MTPIEQQALALINEVRNARGDPHIPSCDRKWNGGIEALCRALERAEVEREAYEAFKRDVSNAVETAKRIYGDQPTLDRLKDFIIPEPVDPLVEVLDFLEQINWVDNTEIAKAFRKALDARGLEIVEKKP